MLKIGEFSKLTRVSVRMLRHYDEMGLLKPAETDRFTGYRYYLPEQLKEMERISSLKDMGFALADIAEMLKFYSDREKLETCLELKRLELESVLKDTAKKLALLDAAGKRLREEKTMDYKIVIKTIPERYAATVHTVIPTYEDESMAWNLLCDETDAFGLVPSEPCICAAVFPDTEYKEENVEIEVYKTVRGVYPDTEHVKFRTLPAVKVASCTVYGGYEQMSGCYSAIFAWLEENGVQQAGPMFNIYHVSPYETQDTDKFVTEVCFPIL